MPMLKHAEYESMEHPALVTASPNMLYIDMHDLKLTTQEVLEAAFLVVDSAVIGFKVFAAQ
jgi:hypothetical protein